MNGRRAKQLRGLAAYDKPEVAIYSEKKGTSKLRRFATGQLTPKGESIYGTLRTVTLQNEDTHRALYRWMKRLYQQ